MSRDADSPQSLVALKLLASAPDAFVRASAIERIRRHPLGVDAAEVIGRALADPSPYVHRAACGAAAELRLASLHDGVRALLTSNDELTRADAVNALATLFRAEDLEPLASVFENDPSPEVRKAAARALAETATPETWRRVFDLLRGGPIPFERSRAAEIAARFGDASVRDALARLAADRDGHVRQAAERAIAGIDSRG